MKILHVTKKYPNALGGDATAVFNLKKQQKKNGHEVFILTTNCDEIIDKENVIKFGLKTNYQDWDALCFKRFISTLILIFKSFYLIKKIKPDIVHSHSAELGFILSFACRDYNIPIINQCRGVSFPYPQTSLIRRIVEKFSLKHGKFNKIITVDKNSLKDFKEAEIENVMYLPNGIELEKFKKREKKKNRKIIFLFVGRIETEKGINEIINATNILKNKSQNFEIRLIGDGKEFEFYEDKIKKLYLEKYIKFLGKKNHKETINEYFNSDVFILPSHQEGFPNTLLEAWGVKLPVIISNVGGVSKVCKNKENTLIIDRKNERQLEEAMIKLIKDEKLRNKLGINGRKLVEEKYNWEKVNKSLEKVYREVLK